MGHPQLKPLPLLRHRIQTWLGQLGLDFESEPEGPMILKHGSTLVFVSTFEDGEHTFCRIAAMLLQDVDASLDLLRHLLRLNTEVLFGGFLLFETNTLAFSATLLGNELEDEVFVPTLNYVAHISDTFDDLLHGLGGGRRGVDIICGR